MSENLDLRNQAFPPIFVPFRRLTSCKDPQKLPSDEINSQKVRCGRQVKKEPFPFVLLMSSTSRRVDHLPPHSKELQRRGPQPFSESRVIPLFSTTINPRKRTGHAKQTARSTHDAFPPPSSRIVRVIRSLHNYYAANSSPFLQRSTLPGDPKCGRGGAFFALNVDRISCS